MPRRLGDRTENETYKNYPVKYYGKPILMRLLHLIGQI
jgi:hypothetical protein